MVLVSAPAGVLAGRVESEVWVEVAGDRIVAVGHGGSPRPPDLRVSGTLLPGFVDQHCHGGAQGDFFGADQQSARTAAELHRRHGTTTIVASLVTAAPEALLVQIDALLPLVSDGTIAGIHLEGPWLSHHRCGAHDPALLRAPDPVEVATLLERAQGHIVMATIAPELPGAMAAITQLVDAGVVAAVGHTDATADIAREAVDRGATVATHLFNQMPAVHKRSGGVVVALLDDDRVTVELICDGVHVDPALIGFVTRSVGAGRVSVVTDAMGAAGAPDGRYLIGQLEVDVVDGVANLAGGGPLAGSTLTMDRALRVLVRDAGVDLAAASRMVATTPAQALGLADRGRLDRGCRADVVVIADDHSVRAVMQGGEWVPDPA